MLFSDIDSENWKYYTIDKYKPGQIYIFINFMWCILIYMYTYINIYAKMNHFVNQEELKKPSQERDILAVDRLYRKIMAKPSFLMAVFHVWEAELKVQ